MLYEVITQGSIHEPHTETQMFLEDFEILSTNQATPSPISLNPPVDNQESEIYYEALEGMLVTVDGPAKAVSPSYNFV